MTDITKPLPRCENLHAEFYEYCKKHELRFQKCFDCGAWRHMPRECCEECGSFNWNWKPSTGRGTLFSWTIIHRALHPSYVDEVPYAVVIVEMEEGVRLVTRLDGISHDELKLGIPLEVFFEDVTPEVALHRFRKPN
jgi:hypothetical protein